MADAKIINYGQQIGGGSSTLPSNVDSALALKDPEGHTYIQIDTDTDQRNIIISAENNADGTTGADWVFDNAGRFSPSASGTVCLNTEDASATNPNVLPHRGDPDTGIGRAAADRLSLIAGGTEALRLGGGGVIGKLETSLTGTFTATNGSAEITSGSSTAFTTQLHVGSAIELFEPTSPNPTSRGIFTVTAIDSGGAALTLDSTVTGLSSSPRTGMTGKTDGGELFAVKTGDSKTLFSVSGTGAIQAGSAASDGSTSNNIAIGDSNALDTITTGTRNIIVGNTPGQYGLTTGQLNILMGYQAGDDLTTGEKNVIIGHDCVKTSTGMQDSVVIGYSAGAAATGNSNVFIGRQAGNSNTANESVAIGNYALDASGGSGTCVSIGHQSLTDCTGDSNIAIGYQAGDGVSNGGGNLLLGHQADCAHNLNYQIAIGFQVSTAAASTAAIGDATRTATLNFGAAGQSWSTTSDERIKENVQDSKLGLNFINALRPITFTEINPADWPEDIRPHVYFDREKTRTNENGEQETYIEPAKEREATSDAVVDGLMAQEVKAAADAEGVSFSGWEQQPNGLQRLQYEKFVLPLIKAVQELSSQNESLIARIEQLESGN